MRIIGGQFKGRKLVEFPGEEVRPTGDRVKESLFNILYLKMYGARVLDVFCGSGALGLECLSRGASTVYFNDCAKSSLEILQKNLALVKAEKSTYRVSNLDYIAFLNGVSPAYDVIFLDPPYRFDYGVPALEVIASRKLLSSNGVVVYERDRSFTGQAPEGLKVYDERKYGKTYLTFFCRNEE